MKTSERGEVATILAISAVIVIGISMISSAFFGGKKQSTSSKASGTCTSTYGLSCEDACDLTRQVCNRVSGGFECCDKDSSSTLPTAVPLPTEPQGAGLIEPEKTVTNTPATQATTAPTAPASTDLCGGSNGACKDNCGSGNDCVKYLESVSVPGLSDGSVINTDSFSCDIVTKNVAGVRTDTDNICGVKVNDQWPAWCPWDGVGQYMCGATITSRANCNLKSSHFSSTPVKAGDKLQIVAARKTGSCGNIPWNTGGSFITGPTFYYKQKGGGGSAPPIQNNPPAGTQPTTALKPPVVDLGDPTKCPDANNVRTQPIGTKAPPYECCEAFKSLSKVKGASDLEYASWSDNGCKTGTTTTAPTTAPAVVPTVVLSSNFVSATSGCNDFLSATLCTPGCAYKSQLAGTSWICMGEGNKFCCPNPNPVTPTKIPTVGPTTQPPSATPTQSGAPSITPLPTIPPTPTIISANVDFNKPGTISIMINLKNKGDRTVEEELSYFSCGISGGGSRTPICDLKKTSDNSLTAQVDNVLRYDSDRVQVNYDIYVKYRGRATVEPKNIINERGVIFRGDQFDRSFSGKVDFNEIRKNFSISIKNSSCTYKLVIPVNSIRVTSLNFTYPKSEIEINPGDLKEIASGGVDTDKGLQVEIVGGVCITGESGRGKPINQPFPHPNQAGINYAFLIDI